LAAIIAQAIRTTGKPFERAINLRHIIHQHSRHSIAASAIQHIHHLIRRVVAVAWTGILIHFQRLSAQPLQPGLQLGLALAQLLRQTWRNDHAAITRSRRSRARKRLVSGRWRRARPPDHHIYPAALTISRWFHRPTAARS
jgi:hypothetical protein